MSEKMLVTRALDRKVLKSTKKDKASSRLAGGNPRGCNVGSNIE